MNRAERDGRLMYIEHQRTQGLSLGMIGEELNISRQRVCKILSGRVQMRSYYLTTKELARLSNCSIQTIWSYKRRGLVFPICRDRWASEVLFQVQAIRTCVICGSLLPEWKSIYCSDECTKLGGQSLERKRLHNEDVKRWQARNPERTKEIQQKANLKRKEKVGAKV